MPERVIFQSAHPVDDAFNVVGTLADWQDQIGRYAEGNSRLMLALGAAFAAPMLHLTGYEGGGFHLKGASSIGKTTALAVAGSVWGGGGIRGYVRSWRTTANALEGIAALHCDTLLCLDEMGQLEPREAGHVAYMLSNGVGKARATRDGTTRKPLEWRLLFLSSGEIGLAEKMAEDGRGRRLAAGQQVRVVDLPADAGAGHGMFEQLHGFANGDALARHLRLATSRVYGKPCRAFIPNLVDHPRRAGDQAAGYARECVEEWCPAGTSGQVLRVAARFGLVAAAGEMAARWGVAPWPTQAATSGAKKCFDDWLAERGGTEPAEVREAITAVRRFIEQHGASRFEPAGTYADPEKDPRIVNRVGFRRPDGSGGTEYLVLPESWRSEVCSGLDPVAAAKVLADRGMLARGSDGKLQDRQRVPGFANPIRCYRLTSKVLDDA